LIYAHVTDPHATIRLNIVVGKGNSTFEMHVLSGYAVVLIYIMSRLTVADSSDKPRRRHDVTLGCVVALLFNGFVAW